MRATPVAARALPVLFAAEDQEFMDYLASLEDPVRAAWGQLVGWVRLRHAQAGSRIFSEAASGTGPLHVQRAPARSNAWGVGSETATQVHEAIPLAAGPDEEQGIAELTSSAATASVDSDSTSTSSATATAKMFVVPRTTSPRTHWTPSRGFSLLGPRTSTFGKGTSRYTSR